MKKTFFALLMVVLSTITAAADNIVPIQNFNFEKELPGGSSQVLIDFPTGTDSPVRRAIIDYIYESLHSFAGSGVNIAFPSNTCDEQTFGTFIEKYTETLCHNAAMDQNEYATSMSEDGETYEMVWFSNLSVQKVADTDLYVSYAFYHGEYCGGAHDNRGSSAITIRKDDGARMTDIFKEDVEEEMQPLLWKYLIASYQPEDEKAFIEEINQFLEANYSIRDYLHLPHGSIYLAPDGVHILYQPLEICFWAAGEPEIVIPFDEARPFLTKEVAELTEK